LESFGVAVDLGAHEAIVTGATGWLGRIYWIADERPCTMNEIVDTAERSVVGRRICV
jgi:hypothetical protein